MDLLDADRKEGLSFFWTIQNLFFRKKYHVYYVSPTFVLDESSDEKWSIKLYPRRNFGDHENSIGLELQRPTTSEKREINVEISIRDGKGLAVTGGSQCHLNFNDSLNLLLTKEIRETCFKNDSLTLLVRIWKDIETRQCYARTIIGAERFFYPCTLGGFEGIENGRTVDKDIIIKLLSEVPQTVMLSLSNKATCADSEIEIKIRPIQLSDQTICEISLIDADGEIAHSVQEEFNSVYPIQSMTVPFIQVSKLLGNKKLYLPNGVMHLSCMFVNISDVKYNKVELVKYKIGKNPLLKCIAQTPDSDLTEPLKNNLQTFYTEGNFSEVTIRTPGKEFHVHKAILCAQSEVFSKMFEDDMKENQTGIVEIEDVDEDTVSRMLCFMYTGHARHLDYKIASTLYVAADKYAIMALRKICADYFKVCFTVTNICDFLVLAERHLDEELKSAAQKFILEHSGEIMESVEWENLMQNHPKLTSETMHLYIRSIKLKLCRSLRHLDEELKSAAQKFILEHSGEIMESVEWENLMQNHPKLTSETMHLYIRSLKLKLCRPCRFDNYKK